GCGAKRRPPRSPPGAGAAGGGAGAGGGRSIRRGGRFPTPHRTGRSYGSFAVPLLSVHALMPFGVMALAQWHHGPVVGLASEGVVRREMVMFSWFCLAPAH